MTPTMPEAWRTLPTRKLILRVVEVRRSAGQARVAEYRRAASLSPLPFSSSQLAKDDGFFGKVIFDPLAIALRRKRTTEFQPLRSIEADIDIEGVILTLPAVVPAVEWGRVRTREAGP